MKRDLRHFDVVSLFLDGKSLGQDAMVVVVGVTLWREKVNLGFVQFNLEWN